MRQKATTLFVAILVCITTGNAYLSATNYYQFRHQVSQEHARFRAELEKEHRLSKIGCERSREFGPPLGKFMRLHHILTPKQQFDYEKLIPSSC